MADPRRMREEGANGFEAKILAAGRKDAPSWKSRWRITAAIGAGALLSLLSVRVATAQVASWLRTGSGALLLRAATGVTLGTLAVWAGATFVRSAPAPRDRPFAPLAARPVLPPRPAPIASPAPTEAQSAAPAPAAVAPAPPPRRPGGAVQEAGSLTDELSALDRARRLLGRGDARGSLRVLDDYARKFPRPHLGSEAAVLRVEALVKTGDSASATQLASAALARQPNGPHARRLRSLIAESRAAAKSSP